MIKFEGDFEKPNNQMPKIVHSFWIKNMFICISKTHIDYFLIIYFFCKNILAAKT